MKKMQHALSVAVLSGFVLMAFGSDDDKKTTVTTETGESVSKPVVEILDHSATYEDMTNTYTVHCRIKNNSDDLVNYVDLNATFYDKAGKIVGTGMGNAANLAAGAEKTVDVMGLDIDNCETYEVQVNNVLD